MSSRAEPGLHRLLLKGLRRFRPPPAKGPHRVAGDTHPQMRPWLSAGKTAAGRFGIRTPPAPPAKTAKRKGGPLDAAVLAPQTKKPPLRTAS